MKAIPWLAVLLFVASSGAIVGLAERASKPGEGFRISPIAYTILLPVFLAACALLVWSERRARRK
jgi:hypothetical protein